MRCRMTTEWKFLKKLFDALFKKSMYFFATYRTLQVSVINFCIILFSKKTNKKFIFLEKNFHATEKTFHARFSFLHAIRIRAVVLNYSFHGLCLIRLPKSFISCNFLLLIKNGFSKNFQTKCHGFSEILTKQNDFNCPRERSTSLLFG